jgi:hypothetical protein
MVEANRGAEVQNGHVKWREDRVRDHPCSRLSQALLPYTAGMGANIVRRASSLLQ